MDHARIQWVAALALLAFAREDDPRDRARAFFESQPRYLRPVLGGPRVQGLADLSAKTCGICHRDVYEEWRISTHARAWTDDAQLIEEMKKHDGTGDEEDARWMCANCHTPYQSQLERLVVGLENGDRGRPHTVANPDFDPRLQQEAVTCAACHVRDGVILGPFGDTRAPHPVAKGAALLSSEVCLDCHQANAELEDVALACVFDTGLEHAATERARAGETCQHCHMPEVVRAIANVPPGKPRTLRRHFFGGSLIPKKKEFAPDMARMREHHVDGLTAAWVDLPEGLRPGEKATLRLAFRNEHAGHRLPSGDPERFLLLKARAVDGEGRVLAELEERIGAVYQWSPLKKLSDNRLAPGERREIALEVVAPRDGNVRLELRAEKHRMSEENFRYHELEGRYVAGVLFLSLDATIPVAR